MRALWIVGLFLLFGFGSAVRAQITEDDREKGLAISVIVSGDCELGSGFFVSQQEDYKMLATAEHLTKCPRWRFRHHMYVWQGQTRYKAKIVARDKTSDIMILKVKLPGTVSTAEFGETLSAWKAPLLSVGVKKHGSSGSLEFCEGYYMYQSKQSISLKMPVWEGMSGGPVLYRGKVVGLINGKDHEGWGFADSAPLSAILKLVNK